eukprot:TRINITY_DN91820_c0_g1_i1.p1 TRINITY_DN91820_c0_g1~~TRINITY_DN91820_c0_g1_i1.p1  ORF type:complete len:158 (-),score=29.24 TRINITY_DN91820_c0_g1_i1:531-941(-)
MAAMPEPVVPMPSFVSTYVQPYAGVLISVLVLFAVEAAAAKGSPRLAAVAAAIPTGTPLALMIVASKGGGQAVLVQFADSVVRAIASTLAFGFAMLLVALRGGGPAAMLGAGVAGWFVTWNLLALLPAADFGDKVE